MTDLDREWDISPVAGPSGLNVSIFSDSSVEGSSTKEYYYEEDFSVDPTSSDFLHLDILEEDLANKDERLPTFLISLDSRSTAGKTMEIMIRDFQARLNDLLEQMDTRSASLPIASSWKLMNCVDNIRKRAHNFMDNIVPKILNVETRTALLFIQMYGESADIWKIVDNLDAHQSLFYRHLFRRHTMAFTKIVSDCAAAITLDYFDAIKAWEPKHVPASHSAYFEGVKLCAQSLKVDLNIFLEDASPENVDFSKIWEILLQLHNAVSEMYYKATGKKACRGSAYLELDLISSVKPEWNDWMDVDRLINLYLYQDRGERSEEKELLRNFLKTNIMTAEGKATTRIVPLTPVRPKPQAKIRKYPSSENVVTRGLSVIKPFMQNYTYDERKERPLTEATCPRDWRKFINITPEDRQVPDEGIQVELGPTSVDLLPYPIQDEVQKLLSWYGALYKDIRQAKRFHKFCNRKAHLEMLIQILVDAENLYESSMCTLIDSINSGERACKQELPRQRPLVLEINRLIKKYLVNAWGKKGITRLEILLKTSLVAADELEEDFAREYEALIPFHLEEDEDEERDEAYLEHLEILKGHLDSLRESILKTDIDVRNVFNLTPQSTVLENMLSSWRTGALNVVAKEVEGMEEKLLRDTEWRYFGYSLQPSPSLMEQKQNIEDRLYYSLHLFLCICLGKVVGQLTPTLISNSVVKSRLLNLKNHLKECKGNTLKIQNTISETWKQLLNLHRIVKPFICRNTVTLTNMEEYLGVAFETPEDKKPRCLKRRLAEKEVVTVRDVSTTVPVQKRSGLQPQMSDVAAGGVNAKYTVRSRIAVKPATGSVVKQSVLTTRLPVIAPRQPLIKPQVAVTATRSPVIQPLAGSKEASRKRQLEKFKGQAAKPIRTKEKRKVTHAIAAVHVSETSTPSTSIIQKGR